MKRSAKLTSLVLVMASILIGTTSTHAQKDPQVIKLEASILNQSSTKEKFPILLELGNYLVQRNPERAEIIADSLMEMMKEIGLEDSTRAYINNVYAASHRWQGNYTTALDYYQRNFEYYGRTKNQKELAFAAKKIGTINTFLGNNEKSQKYLLIAAEIFKDNGTPVQQASINSALASFYLNIDKIEDALNRYKEALNQYEILNDSAGMASINANLGYVYTTKGEYEVAEKHLGKMKSLCGVFPTNRELGFYHDFMGNLWKEKGELGLAYQEHLIALEIRQGLSSTYNLCESKLNTGSILIELGKYDEAISHLKDVFSYQEHQSLNQQSSAHSLLTEAYEKKKSFAKALFHHQQFKHISDSIYNDKSLQIIEEKDAKYQRQEKDTEIALLAGKHEIAKAELSKSRIIQYGSMMVALIIAGFLFFIYQLYQKVKYQNNVVNEALKEKDLLIKEIHHRVKNNLQIISSLLNLQAKYVKDQNAMDAINDGKNRVQSMALLHQNLYRDNNVTSVQVKEYFENLVDGILHTYNTDEFAVDIRLKVDPIALDIDTVIPIGLITNELITNSLKYAFPHFKEDAAISVYFYQDNEELVLEVKDNGKGIEDNLFMAHPANSFGHQMIGAFVKKLKANLSVKNNDGTSISIKIPKKKVAA